MWAREDGLIIPDMKLLRRIGSGSYGEVWMARSITGALRAVKVVWREDFEQEKTFRREFEGIEQFEPISRGHPGLVNILHVGWNEERGFYYYVMELADDSELGPAIKPETYVARTLSSDFKRHGRLNLEFCKKTGIYLADALGYMHSYGLTHRDIKPSNIIFVKGAAKLADIGLVATHGERTFVGTEGFVPPEGPGTFSADLYSLGKVLYEISSGNDRMEFPAVPDDLSAAEWTFWRDWNKVICKACVTEVKQRYATAADFAAALKEVGVPRPVPLRRRLASGFFKVAFWALMAGPLLAMLKREHSWSYVVPAPDLSKLTVKEIVNMKMPMPGHNWFNSFKIGGEPMKFIWQKDRHVAQRPVDMELFNLFLLSSMQSFEGDVVQVQKKSGKLELVVFVPKQDAQDFCDWMTEQDRASNLLTEDYEYSWRPAPNIKPDRGTRPGWKPILLEVVKLHFGRVVVDSVPQNAEILDKDNEVVGYTPLVKERVRVGDFTVTVHLQGYKRAQLTGKVEEGKSINLGTKLKASGSVVFGSRWRNSLDMELVPLGHVLIGSTEIRRRDYATFLHHLPLSSLPPVDVSQDINYPMTHVSRADARVFCAWLTQYERSRGLIEDDQSYRLPNDDEWSMAADLPRERGDTPSDRNLRIGSFFPWGVMWPPQPVPGNFWSALANEKTMWPDGPGRRTELTGIAAVGTYPPDSHGLFDLSGNVWEWVDDDFGGPDVRFQRHGVLRGGSWKSKERTELLASFRKPIPATQVADDVGFRIILSPKGGAATDLE